MTDVLDQKGLHAATDAYNEFECGSDVDHVRKIVRAYLSTVIPAEIAEVVERLRKRAASHEAIRKMDKNAFCEQADIFLAREAATLIERLAASRADLQEALAESDRNAEKLEALLDPHIAWEGRPSASQVETRRQALEEAAKMVEDFGWVLPMFESAEINEATDDAACAVQGQIARAIRSLIDQPSTEGGKDG